VNSSIVNPNIAMLGFTMELFTANLQKTAIIIYYALIPTGVSYARSIF